MVSIENKVIRKKGKKPLIYDATYIKNSVKKPVVILCHGYMGFKDWGAWGLAGKEFSKNNFFFVKFNFSHNGGTMEQPIDFPDLNSFANNDFTHELEDIDRIIEHLKVSKTYSQDLDFNNISLVGHSRGAGTVLIKTFEDTRIKKVITWAGVSDFKKRFQEGTPEFYKWEKEGVIYGENSRTKQFLPHFFQFFEDFKKNEARFNIKSAVEKLKVPYLIIHGSNDTSVLPIEGENLFSWNKQNKIERIKDADHVFSSKHPWNSKTLPKHLKKVVYLSIDFLNSN